MPNSVLLLCPDVISERMAGPAIRYWEFAKSLAPRHPVTLAMSNEVPAGLLAPEGVRLVRHTPGNVESLCLEHEIIVVHGYILKLYPVIRDTDKILVADIYDPIPLESLELQQKAPLAQRMDDQAFQVAMMNEQLLYADYFLCASERQKDLWLGGLLALGRINPVTYTDMAQRVAVVPFGLPDRPAERTGPGFRAAMPEAEFVLLWGGGVWEWFDPLTVIHAVHRLLPEMPGLRLVFLGTRHPNPGIPLMPRLRQARELARALEVEHAVIFQEGWVDYASVHNHFLDADVCVSAHFDTLETRYAFRTRMLHYLWAGKPIITTRGDTLAQTVAQAGAGIAVDYQDVAGWVAAIRKLRQAEFYRQCVASAQALAPDYRWSQVTAPLLEICRQATPVRDVSRSRNKGRRVAYLAQTAHAPCAQPSRRNEELAREALNMAFDSPDAVIDLPAQGLTVPTKLFSDESLATYVLIPEYDGINFAMPVTRGKTLRWACHWKETEAAATVLIKLGTYQRTNQCALELRLVPLNGASPPYQARLSGAELADNYYAAFVLDRPLLPGGYTCELSSPDADDRENLLALWLTITPAGRRPGELAPAFPPHPETAIIVCIHNALEDVRRCLESVQKHTSQPYTLILVDDGSDAETRDYLRDYAGQTNVRLQRNEQAGGYTRAANQGMRAAAGTPYLLLLNSDTVVSPGWLERLLACAESDPAIGLAGPLSNTASWQSIPEIEQHGDWAANPLPQDLSVEQMAARVAAQSARLYPRLPFLNGFCLLIKRQVIERIGFFDEENFPQGYGEENDYCIRARQAGWQLALADDAYIYHAQSKSYSHERRKQLAQQAWQALTGKHAVSEIEAGVEVCRHSPAMQGIRQRARVLLERWNFIEQGQYRWQGKRVAFILPIHEAGGGANVVLMEARAMRRMGVDACILNLRGNRESFARSYPDLDVPVLYFAHPADNHEDLLSLCRQFDAVIATAHFSVGWIAPLADAPAPILGYYIQDFEPYFYLGKPNNHAWFWRSIWLRRRYASYYFRRHPEFRHAWLSYSRIPRMIRFTKTAWNQREVIYQTGQSCARVGPSCHIDMFMPRRERSSQGCLRVTAMVRPSSPRRNPLRTMQVLRRLQRTYPDKLDITIFGAPEHDPLFLALPRDFVFTNLGHIPPEQIARLFSESDIFADFSVYQAMGLTAMEAMACGVAVILPQAGGAEEFAGHEKNALLIDSRSSHACYQALERLVNDAALRRAIAQQASLDMVACYPEKAAYRMLGLLFDTSGTREYEISA